MMFGMAQSVFAQHIYIEDTPVGYTYLFERYGYSVLTAESHSDDIVGYAYADFEDHTSSANRNGAASVTVYTDKPMTFSTDMLDAIYAADVNLSYAFRYEGHMYKITIPRGAKVDLGGSKYEGPLFVGSLLGTTQVIE